MTRRITIALGFLATLLAVDFAVRRSDDQLAIYEMDRIARKQAVLESLDPPPGVVIFGSSRTAYAMAPEEFERATGLPAFNFGIPASKVFEWRLIVRNAVQSVRPRMIVLGVNASAIRSDNQPIYAAQALFNASDFAEYTLQCGWSNEIAANFFERRLMQAWPTFERNHEIKFWLQERLARAFPKHAQLARERREMVAEPCPINGFDHPWLIQKRLRNLQQQIDERGDAFVQKGSIPEFDPNSDAMREFDRLLADLKSTGIPAVICYLPNSPRTVARWRDVEPAMKAALCDACERRGIPFLDGTDLSGERVNADYVDESHAGLPLARALSYQLAARAVAMGVLDADGPVYASGRDEGTLGP